MKKNIELLSWDSSFFGFPIASLNVKNLTVSQYPQIIKELKKQKIKLAYWFVNSDDINSHNTAGNENLLLVDERLTYIKKNLSFDKSRKELDNISSYLHKPISETLLNLILQSGIYSRYKVDSHFKSGEYERLYKEWLEQSLLGNIANDVLVYCLKGREVGIITLAKDQNTASIGLFAVDKDFRRQSIGSKLVTAACFYASEWGIKDIKVVTQADNLPACRLYEKLGFVVQSRQEVYHIWLHGKKKNPF